MKKHLKVCLLVIFATACLEWIFKELIILNFYPEAVHPWRVYGGLMSALSGITIVSIPVLMRDAFNEQYTYGLIMGACVAGLFSINDIGVYFIPSTQMSLGELGLWVLLEWVEFLFLGVFYIYLMQKGYTQLKNYFLSFAD